MFVANITILPLVMAQAMLSETVGDDTRDTDTGIPDTGVPGTSQTKGKYRAYTAAFKLSTIEECRDSTIRSVGRKYNINESTIRGWIKNESKLRDMKPGVARGSGGGKKPTSEDMEIILYDWIINRRSRNLRVTVKSICEEALAIFNRLEPDNMGKFQGSRGWFKRFKVRHGLTIRKKTTQTQRTPSDLVPKVVRFLLYIRKVLEETKYQKVIAYDETACWFDAVGDTTVEKVGAQDVTMASTGHEKVNVTVGLAYASDGSKLVPTIVFKGKGLTKEDKDLCKRKDINVCYSSNGWFNTELTVDWIDNTLGQTLFGKRLLI